MITNLDECSQCEVIADTDDSDYEALTGLDWAEYEFATIEYDYNIHPNAANSIRAIFERLYKG